MQLKGSLLDKALEILRASAFECEAVRYLEGSLHMSVNDTTNTN